MGVPGDHDAPATPALASSSRKRKREHQLLSSSTAVSHTSSPHHPTSSVRRTVAKSTFIDLDNAAGDEDWEDWDDAAQATPSKKTKKKPTRKASAQPTEEKRLRRYRPKPPQSFDDIYLRATTQRFYVLSRTRRGTAACPEEVVELTGSTGNIYHVCIAKQPTCDCPHASAGNQCKHMVYVMSRVLHAKHEYVYQLALLSTELQDIFANAPPPVDDDPSASTSNDKNRKPVEGDCPICFNELDPTKEEVVWCRAACGQNIHKECFSMWAATKRQNTGKHAEVTCPFCRSAWQGDEDMVRKIKKTGSPNEDGYVNVADQLGISQERGMANNPQLKKPL